MAKRTKNNSSAIRTEMSNAQVEESLSTIFRDEDGEMPDLTRMETRRSPRLLMICLAIAGFVLILLAAAWSGFLLFKPFRGFQGQGLQIAIDGPERIALGQETTYFINWQNVSSGPLAAADIRVSFPIDFTMTKQEPAPNEGGQSWRLGSVAYGGRGTITVKGIFTGALGTKTAVQAVGTFRPASFNSEFEALATRQVEYSDTVLSGGLVMPAKALPGDKVRISYVLQNRGLAPMTKLEARLTLPEGFVRDATVTGSSAFDGRVVRLPIGDLAAGASTTVSVTGSFASGHAGEAAVHAEAGRIGLNGAFQPVQKTDASLAVLSGDLTLLLVANGSDADRSVVFGETLRFTLGFENTADEPITDVALRFKIQPVISTSTSAAPVGPKKPASSAAAFIDWSHVEDSASGTRSGNTFTWTKEEIGVLARLPPHQDGTVDVSLPIIPVGTEVTSFQIIAEATMKSVGDTVVNRTVTTAPITFRFRTDADLASEARYFSEEGAPLGSGPLPPVVGQTTRYRIFWDVSKTIHELKNLNISAPLAKRAAWPGKFTVSAGEMKYDDATRLVTWTLNRMPTDVNEAHATFDIDLTPTEFDAGRFADLLGDTKFQVLDADIAESIVRSKPAITTDLQNDEGARSKGVVKKP